MERHTIYSPIVKRCIVCKNLYSISEKLIDISDRGGYCICLDCKEKTEAEEYIKKRSWS